MSIWGTGCGMVVKPKWLRAEHMASTKRVWGTPPQKNEEKSDFLQRSLAYPRISTKAMVLLRNTWQRISFASTKKTLILSSKRT